MTITDARLPDNPIIYCNEAFMKLTGYSKDEIINKNCRFLQGTDTDPETVTTIRSSIKAAKDFSVILKNYTKSGQAFWNDLQISPVYDDSGALTHFIGLQTDVTERIEREKAIAATRQLEHEKMLLATEREQLIKMNEIKDDFIAVASHQLRTPATVVKQYLGMVIDEMFGTLEAAQVDALRKAYDSNERQLKIIDDLLKVARIDTGKVILTQAEVDLGELLRTIASEFTYRLVESDQNLELDVPSKKALALVDKELFRTGIENILDNAIKYSKNPGTIVIKLAQTASHVTISISDQGIGISESDMKKMYQKFTRSNSEGARNIGGTGLGLYWAKTIFEKHGATMSSESELGVGSKFTITIPKQKSKLLI